MEKIPRAVKIIRGTPISTDKSHIKKKKHQANNYNLYTEYLVVIHVGSFIAISVFEPF